MNDFVNCLFVASYLFIYSIAYILVCHFFFYDNLFVLIGGFIPIFAFLLWMGWG